MAQNWEALLRNVDDGRIEIDNNAAERALRAVALGRNNYLSAGSDPGGELAAAIYILIATAKLNDLDPESHLQNVLARIADDPINRIEELLLWNLAAELAHCQPGAAWSTKLPFQATAKPRRLPKKLVRLFLSHAHFPLCRLAFFVLFSLLLTQVIHPQQVAESKLSRASSPVTCPVS